ncbi:MAG TPA: hypothetical protein VK641_10695, partial [Terriglobales bacterium]|nr:hypothetical protein [Terriglobales bacterium]
LQEGLARIRTARGIGRIAEAIEEVCKEIRPFERVRRVHLASAAGLLLLAALFASGQKGFEAQFDPESFPHQVIPIVGASAAKHILSYDQWGDYLIYQLYPSKQVFMDGRSDFYGYDFINVGQHIISARYDWAQQLDHFVVDMVLVKPDAPLATVLKTSPGWRLLFDDGKAIVFQAKLSAMRTSDRRPDRRPPLSGAQ